MIDRYKYTWKMIKPLIPIVGLAAWVIIFEDKIWHTWEEEIPIKSFNNGEIEWEFEMDPSLASSLYRFKFVEFEGKLDSSMGDTLLINNKIFCTLDKTHLHTLDSLYNKNLQFKGRILGYNESERILRLDHCFVN